MLAAAMLAAGLAVTGAASAQTDPAAPAPSAATPAPGVAPAVAPDVTPSDPGSVAATSLPPPRVEVVTPPPLATPSGVGAPPAAGAASARYRRHLAFGVGTGTGLGLISAALRARVGYVALEGAAGFAPVMAMSLGDAACTDMVIAVPPQLTGSALAFFLPDQKKFVPGMRLGATYTSELDWGALVGFEGELRLSQLLSLSAGAGVKVMPEGNRWAEARLREKVAAACYFQESGANVVFPYLNFQVLLYAL